MKVHILGSSTDDTGKQLEQLTTIILEREGYTGCNCNKIIYGGGEIDVCAKKSDHNVIYECKAHKKPIGITDWLKFVGKIYTENLINPNTQGVLIALSGVNGNVRGHYEQINAADENLVRLIEEEELTKFIENEYGMPDTLYIRQKLSSLTDRIIKEFEIGYYEFEMYLICKFTDGTFAIFNKSIDIVQYDNIIQFTKVHLPNYNYINLEEEIQSKLRKSFIVKVIINLLINEKLSIEDIKVKITSNPEFGDINNISKSEIKNAITNLTIITYSDHKSEIKLLDLNDYVEFYRVVLDGVLFLPIFESDIYLNNINEALLTKILEIQGGVKLNKDEFVNCLMAIKYSPYAMQYAINEDHAITRYRQNGKALMNLENLENGHSKWFVRRIISLFKETLNDQRLYELYLNKYDVGSIIEGTTFSVNIGQITINFSEQTKGMLGKISNFGDGTSIARCLMLPEDHQEE